MAESKNTTDGGTAGSSESAQDVIATPNNGVNDVIVENLGDVSTRPDGVDYTARIENAAIQATGSAVADSHMLRLVDLLQTAHDGNLDTLLTFTSDGTNTTLHVGSAQAGQDIVLQGVGDLTAGGARTASAIIADLLTHGSLSPDV
jgi:hypothetical protein